MLHHQHSQYVELQENLLGLSPLIATITIITICKAFKCVPVALSHVTPTWYHSHGSLGRPFKGNPCSIHNTHHCRHSWSISQEFMFWQTLLAPSETLVFILVHTRNPLFQMFQVWSNAAYIHSLIINRVAKCQTFYTDQNMASDIFKKEFYHLWLHIWCNRCFELMMGVRLLQNKRWIIAPFTFYLENRSFKIFHNISNFPVR